MRKILILANDTTYTYNLRYEILKQLISLLEIMFSLDQVC